MIKILFVCHGNICRSPMAEFVMKDLVNKSGYSEDFFIASKATSTEELGNSPHYGTRSKLKAEGIPMEAHRASQMDRSDYNKFDYIIGMDAWNYKNILRITGGDPEGKVSLLLDFAGCHVILLTRGTQVILIKHMRIYVKGVKHFCIILYLKINYRVMLFILYRNSIKTGMGKWA